MKQSGQLFFIMAFFITGFLSGCAGNGGNATTVPDSLREDAVEILRHNLETQSQWVKVHAAEYLLWLGHPQGVQETFIEQQRLHGNESPYRIGIWRVLAQAATIHETKQTWIDKILEVYGDTAATDRVHAAETLAKLKVSPLRNYLALTQEILSERDNPLSVYIHWAVADSQTDTIKIKSKYFLDLLTDRGKGVPLRSLAAYALRHLSGLDTNEWGTLAEVALSEPKISLSRIYLLSAAFVTAPDDSVQSKTWLDIRRELLSFKNSSNPGEVTEMTAALAEKGGIDDLPVLVSLMNEEGQTGNKINNDPDRADIRDAAAYAVLRIDKKMEHALTYIDWLVIAVYLLGMLSIGFYYYRKNKNQKDFFLGGGKMNPIAVGLSLFATFTSAISYMAYPGEMIKHGPVVFAGIIAFPIAYYIVGWFIIPRLKKFNVTSAYEILEIKLGVSVRMLATFFFLILRLLWMATIIYITVNIVVLSVFKIDPAYSLPISAALMVITIVYTAIGGLKAVVVTDAIQALILLGGALVVILVVSVHFGSLTSWLPDHWLNQWGAVKFRIDARDRSSIGAAILMTLIWYVASAGADQMSIQRFLATKDTRSARKTFGVSLIATLIGMCLLGLVGLALIAYFKANPQYLSYGKNINDQADKLFPRFMVIGLPAGISGLLVAAVLAAAMSSLSSGLNSCASVITEDIIKRFKSKAKKSITELKQVQRLSLLIGVITLILSAAIPYVSGNLYDLTVKVVNLLVSPLFVLFFMALFVPFATARGTFIGGIVSVIIAIAIAFFGFLRIDVFFITIASLATGIIIGTLCSFIDYKVLGNRDIASNRNKN